MVSVLCDFSLTIIADSGENERCQEERGKVFSVLCNFHLPSEPDSGENARCEGERGEMFSMTLLTYRQSLTPERMLRVRGRGGGVV